MIRTAEIKKSPVWQRALICLMLLWLLVSSACGHAHMHQKEGRELVGSINLLLVSEKLCKDGDECRAKEYIFLEPERIISVSVYGINDESIAKKIVALCIDAHAKNPGIQHELYMYRETKEQSLKGGKKTVLLQLTLKREK